MSEKRDLHAHLKHCIEKATEHFKANPLVDRSWNLWLHVDEMQEIVRLLEQEDETIPRPIKRNLRRRL